MAEINVGVNKTNDPSYLNSSQGTDRASLQQLSTVPELSTKYVTPDYQASRAAGTGIKGLGDLAEAGIKLTDQVIQEKADQTLRKGIDGIRDSFGVAQAADQSTGIAKAVGASGAEGVSLSQGTDNQPIAINRLGNKVEGLTESYRQGGLSNSAYYAKLEAFVRETKAQFPGYNEIIDQKVAGIVGTTPANALRSSLLQDVAETQKKVQSLNDKWTTYEHAKAGTIYSIWPNYDQMKAQGKIDRGTVEAEVGRREARDYKMDVQLKQLAVTKGNDAAVSDNAFDIAIQKSGEISRNVVIGTTNSMGITNAADLQKYIADVNSGNRKPPTPDEQTQLTGMFSILKQKATAAFDQFVNTPLNGNTTETLASKLRDPQKLAQAREVAMGDIKTIEDGLLNEKHGLVAATVSWNKASDALADKNLTTNMPNASIVGALHRKIGDQSLSQLFIDEGPTLMAGLRRAGWQDLDNKVPIKATLDKMKSSSNNDPAVIRQTVLDGTKMIIHKDKLEDPTLSDRAFVSLYGPGNTTLIDGFQGKVQTAVYGDIFSPAVTKAVSKRSKDDQTTYIRAAEEGFASVFAAQAMGANAAAESYSHSGALGKFALKYDPLTNNFHYETPKTMPKIAAQSADGTLKSLNSAINTVKEVYKLNGKDPTDALYSLLPTVGIEGGSPIFKAIQEEYMKKQPKETGSG